MRPSNLAGLPAQSCRVERLDHALLIISSYLLEQSGAGKPESSQPSGNETLMMPLLSAAEVASAGQPATGPALTMVAAGDSDGPAAEMLASMAPPLPGVVAEGRRWVSQTSGQSSAYGCSSHHGPPGVTLDKENEDFAFSVELADGNGERWICSGVADGVSGSTWSARGAVHAAGAFLETLRDLLAQHSDLGQRLEDPGFRVNTFGNRLNQNIQSRLERDERIITSRRLLHPSWNPELYNTSFFDHAHAAERRRSWFQSTLLAAALGPRGGFALFLGDGYARVGRRVSGGDWQRKPVPLVATDAGGAPEVLVTRWLTPLEISSGMRYIPPHGASELELLLATDGVFKTPEHGLDALELGNSADCQEYLDQLAARPPGQVDLDNLSVAFVRRVLNAGD